MNLSIKLVPWLVPATFMAAALFIVLHGGGREAFADDPFLRGDVNTDGQVSISDVLMVRRWLFNGDRAPACMDSADVDDNAQVDISDPIKLLHFAFLGGLAPPAPFPAPGNDPTSDGLTCDSYVVVQPEETNDLLRIGDVVGSPGGSVRIPVILDNSADLEAFQVVLSYDPRVLVNISDSPPAEAFRGSYYEGKEASGGFFTIRPNPDAGIIVCGFVPHLTQEGFELPPGSGQIVFFIPATVSPDAPEGTVVHLDPVNAGYGPAGLKNEVTHRGDARFVSIVPKTVGGILNIVPDQTPFVRGDSNSDAKVNISDAQFTLNFLFLGEPTPSCLDAADANDDNRVDISDAISTLQFLFLGGSDPPQPYPLSGMDPTPDGLRC